MDDIDRKIISELQTRGFKRAGALTTVLNVSARTISRRIGNLRTSNLIKIIAVPNPFLFGNRAWAKIGIKIEPRSLRNVTRELVTHPSIYFVAYTLGVFDIIIAITYDSFDKLTSFVNSELVNIPGLLSSETMMLMNPRKYYNFYWDTKIRNRELPGEIDDIDRKILKYLSVDALIHPEIIRDELGIGESTIRRRIKRMFNSEAYKLEVVPNPQLLKNHVWATLGITVNQTSPNEILDVLVKNPAVYLASASTGRFNIIISTRFTSMDLLSDFLSAELPKIKGVNSIESFLHNRPLKYHNIDWSSITT